MEGHVCVGKLEFSQNMTYLYEQGGVWRLFFWETGSDDTQGLGADTHQSFSPTLLHTQCCKTVHRAQFGTAKLLHLSRVPRPQLNCGATVTQGSKKLRLCDIPRGCVLLRLLRDRRRAREQESASTAPGPINTGEERTGKFAFLRWQLAQPPFSPVRLYLLCYRSSSKFCFTVLSFSLFMSFYHGPHVNIHLSPGMWLMGRITEQSHRESRMM